MTSDGIKVIITGATGMVGEGVLLVCLENPAVSNVLIINRKPLGITHPKLKEIIHQDFNDLAPVAEHLAGYDACFFCLGVTSVGIKIDKYRRITYDLTMHFGETVSRLNPGTVFIYVSGAGTDSTEKGKVEWARIKGKTENDLRKLSFKKVYGYRPGFIKPYKGQKKAHAFYTFINWFFPIGRKLNGDYFNTMEEMGLSMIRLARHDYHRETIYGKDISILAAL